MTYKAWAEDSHIVYCPPDEIIDRIELALEDYEKADPAMSRRQFASDIISDVVKFFITGEIPK